MPTAKISARLYKCPEFIASHRLLQRIDWEVAMTAQSDRYVFGPFELIPDRNILISDGVPVPLGGRATKILSILVRQAGQVVGGQALALWSEISL